MAPKRKRDEMTGPPRKSYTAEHKLEVVAVQITGILKGPAKNECGVLELLRESDSETDTSFNGFEDDDDEH